MIHVPWIKYNLHRKAPKKLYSTRYKSIISICILHSTSFKKKKSVIDFFPLSFILLFSFFFFYWSWQIYNTHGGERSKEKNCRVCINISRQHLANNNLLRNPVKRKLSSSALFNLLHVHFHGNIFFLTNSNEYLIRKQLRTFTSMQSYFQLKKKYTSTLWNLWYFGPIHEWVSLFI